MSFWGAFKDPLSGPVLGGSIRQFIGGLAFNFGLFKFSVFFKKNHRSAPRFSRCMVGVVNRPFIGQFVSVIGPF